MSAPPLRTKRLILFPLGSPDLDEAAALYGDKRVMEYVDGGTRDRATASHILAANERCWKSEGWGLWAIRDAETGAFVGECGPQRLSDVPGARVDFTGVISRRYWGRGMATEAGQALLYDLWDRFDGQEVHSIVHPENPTAGEVLRKLGFRRLADQLIHGANQQLWQTQRLG